MGKYIINQATRTGTAHERKGLGNEDHFTTVIHGDRIWIGVFDGVSQGGGGGVASTLVGECMEKVLEGSKENDINYCGETIMQQAQEAILSEGEEHPEYGKMQTTAVIACLEQESRRLTWFSIGDSAIFIVPRRGKARKQTTEDTDVGELVALGKMSLREATRATVGHELNRWLGMPVLPEKICGNIRTGSTILGRKDSLVVCSDGFYTKVPSAVLADWLRKGRDAAEMVKSAKEMGSMDDITVICAIPEDARCSIKVPIEFVIASVVFFFALGFLCGTGVSLKMKDSNHSQRPSIQNSTGVEEPTDSLIVKLFDHEAF